MAETEEDKYQILSKLIIKSITADILSGKENNTLYDVVTEHTQSYTDKMLDSSIEHWKSKAK